MKILDLIAWNQDWVTGIFTGLLPTLILFYCLLMFYRFAPRGTLDDVQARVASRTLCDAGSEIFANICSASICHNLLASTQ